MNLAIWQLCSRSSCLNIWLAAQIPDFRSRCSQFESQLSGFIFLYDNWDYRWIKILTVNCGGIVEVTDFSLIMLFTSFQWQLPTGGNYKTAKPLQVRTTGVIGAGTMGAGIALSLITSGLPCILVEQNKEVLLCLHDYFCIIIWLQNLH